MEETYAGKASGLKALLYAISGMNYLEQRLEQMIFECSCIIEKEGTLNR